MWSDLARWFASPAGQRALTDAVLPVAAILIAALLAALIARGAIRRLERRIDRESLVAAVAGFVEAARRIAGKQDPGSATQLAHESDVRMRLSGRPGADLAAEWALLVTLAARGDDPTVVRDRLLAWSRKPGRANRLFGADLEALRRPAAEPQRAAAQPTTAAVPEAAVASAAAAPDAPVASTAAAPVTPPPLTAARRTGPDDRGLEQRPVAVAAADHTNRPRVDAEVEEAPAARPLEPAPLERGSAQPAWLDDYDDDAHVTRNIPLNTPAPVSASAVRDRGRPGDDIVPS